MKNVELKQEIDQDLNFIEDNVKFNEKVCEKFSNYQKAI